MEKVYARTKGIRDDMVSGFCPGCMHSTVIKLIGEVLEEMHLLDKAACAVGVGCCGLHMDYITYDYFLAAHGRACAVATGAKRSNPESLRFISPKAQALWAMSFATFRALSGRWPACDTPLRARCFLRRTRRRKKRISFDSRLASRELCETKKTPPAVRPGECC